LDYAFEGTADRRGSQTAATLLVAVHRQSGTGFAVVVETKGAADVWAVQQLQGWLLQVGIAGPLIVKSDSEPAARAVAQALARARGAVSTIVQTTPPTASHDSLGGVERFIQTLHGLVRTQLLVIGKLWELKVSSNSVWHGWAVRHAVWFTTTTS
jgi:hypothetical protein